MKIGRWLLMAALMTTCPAQFQQRSQPNPSPQRQCRIGRGSVNSLREGLSVDFHGKECSRATCHRGGHTEFTECPRVNKTPTNCGNGLFYQKYPHCCDYKYCPFVQNKSTAKWKPFLITLANRQSAQAVIHNSAFGTRQISWRRKEAAAGATEKLERYKATTQNEQAAGRSWLAEPTKVSRPQNAISTNEYMWKSSLVRSKRSYSFNYDPYARTMQLHNGVGLQTPPDQPGFMNAANKVYDLVGSAVQAVIQKVFGRPYETVGQTPGKQTGERGTTREQLTNAVRDKTLRANTAKLQASVRQAAVEQLVGGAARKQVTEHPTELLAKGQEAVGYSGGRHKFGDITILPGSRVEQAFGQAVRGEEYGWKQAEKNGGGRTSVIGNTAYATQKQTSPGMHYFEEPLQIIEDRRIARMKATAEQRTKVLEKNEQGPRTKSDSKLAAETRAYVREADGKATPERKPTKAKSGEGPALERRETGEKAHEQGGRTTGGLFNSATTTSGERTRGRSRGRERTGGWEGGGRRATGGETGSWQANGGRNADGRSRDRPFTRERTAGGRTFGERSRDGQDTDRGARGWRSTGGQGTGGRYAGGRDYGGRDTGGRDRGGRYTGGRDYGGRDTGGRDRGGQYGGGRYGGGRDRGGQYGGGRYGGGRDRGGQYGGGRYTGGRYTGGRDFGGRYMGGRDAGGRDTGGRDAGGRDTGGQYTGGRSRNWRTRNYAERGRARGEYGYGGTGRRRWGGGRDADRWETRGRAGDAGVGYRQAERVGERTVGETETVGAMAPEEEALPTEVSADGKKIKGKKARRLAQAEKARLAAERKAARRQAARAQNVESGEEEEEEGPTPVMVAEGLVKPGEQQARAASAIPEVKGYKAREQNTRRRKAKKQAARQRQKDHRTARRKAAPNSGSQKSDETFYVTSSEAEENGDGEPFTGAQEKEVLEKIGKKAMRTPKANDTNPSMLGNIGAETEGFRGGAQRDDNPNRQASADLTFKDVREIVRDQLTNTKNAKRDKQNLEEADAENEIRATTVEKQSTDHREVNNQTSDQNRMNVKMQENITNSHIGGNSSINMEKRETSKYVKEDTNSQIRGNKSINGDAPGEDTYENTYEDIEEDTKSEYSSKLSFNIRKSGENDRNSTIERVVYKQVYTKDWYKYNAESRYRNKYERKMAKKKENEKNNQSKANGESSETSKSKIKESSEQKSESVNNEHSNQRTAAQNATSEGKKIKEQDDGSTSSIDSQAKPGPSLREQKERRMAERRRRKMRRKRRKQLSRRRLKASMNKIRASMSKITFNKTAVVIEASNATYEANPTISPTRELLSSKELEAIRQARKERRRARRRRRGERYLARINRGRLNRTMIGKTQMLENGTVFDTYEHKNSTTVSDDGQMYTNSTALIEEVKPANSRLELGRPFGLFKRDYMTPEEIEARRASRRERRKLKRITRRRKFAGQKLHEAKLKVQEANLKRQQRDGGTSGVGRLHDRGRSTRGRYRDTSRRGVGQGYEEEGGYDRRGYGKDNRRGNGKYVSGGYDGWEGDQYGGSGRNRREMDVRIAGEGGYRNGRGGNGRGTGRGVVYLKQKDGYMTVDSRDEGQADGYNYNEGGRDLNVDGGGYVNAGARGADQYSKERHADGGVDGRTAGEHEADTEGGNVDRGPHGNVDGREGKNANVRAGNQGGGSENIDGKGNGNIDSTRRENTGGRAGGHEDVGDRDVGGHSNHDAEVVDRPRDEGAPRNRTATKSRKSSAERRPLSESIPAQKQSEEQTPPSRLSDESSASLPGKSKRKRKQPLSSESPDGLPKQKRSKKQEFSMPPDDPFPKQKRAFESPPIPNPQPTFTARERPTATYSPQTQRYYHELRRVRQRYAGSMDRYKRKLTPKEMLLRERQRAHRAKIRNRHKTPHQLKADEKRRRARREKARKVKNRMYPVAQKGKTRKGRRPMRKKKKVYRRHK